MSTLRQTIIFVYVATAGKREWELERNWHQTLQTFLIFAVDDLLSYVNS
jgi:hypothetical protein